ncbi:DUF6129 family protein [Pseudomonas sp.]|uniref:DUF6129 family protein n=1 Tax=Pseudomonas sp. TaxID=306 RepID=UPI0028A5980B|nr:DUF6129 family protein [Pseudomonas sp.]
MLEEALLDRLAAEAAQAPLNDQRLAELRLAFPGLSVTLCSDNDVPPKLQPVRGSEAFSLYLVDAREHCASLTNDAQNASGVVLALHDDD